MTAQHKTLLIVEDERLVREILGAVLDDEGYLTLLAENGQQAMDMLHTHVIDLVLSDISMPKIGGIELDDYCRQYFPSMPFMLMSGSNRTPPYSSEEKRLESGKTPGPARTVLKKPFELHELLQTVADMFEA
ncbi:MAG: response regulator [Granulosicoccaceae bacterium]